MVSRVGLEPTTPSLRGSCSNQLSYRPDSFVILSFFAHFVQKENKNYPHLFIFPPKYTIITLLQPVDFFYTRVDGTFTFFKGGKYGSGNYLNGRITL